jgi:CheY-like chemotaxis protein
LRAVGYLTIAFAVTEEDAISAARIRCPDLITADVQLASGCGIAAVEEICSHRSIPVVFITASAAKVRQRVPDAIIVRKPFAGSSLAEGLAVCRAGPAFVVKAPASPGP